MKLIEVIEQEQTEELSAFGKILELAEQYMPDEKVNELKSLLEQFGFETDQSAYNIGYTQGARQGWKDGYESGKIEGYFKAKEE